MSPEIKVSTPSVSLSKISVEENADTYDELSRAGQPRQEKIRAFTLTSNTMNKSSINDPEGV